MTGIPRSLVVSAVSLLTSLIFVAALSLQAFGVLRQSDLPVRPPTPAPDEKEEIPRETTFDEFLSRPLFVSGRRAVAVVTPLPPQETIAPAPAPETRRFAGQLTGVVLSNSKRSALIKMEDASSVSVSEGNAIGAWTLAEVSPDHVVLRLGTDMQVLEFAKHGTNAPATSMNSPRPLKRR